MIKKGERKGKGLQPFLQLQVFSLLPFFYSEPSDLSHLPSPLSPTAILIKYGIEDSLSPNF
jgi:hypothetical protein